MRCAVNATTTERGPRVAGLPGGVRPAAECHYRLAAAAAAAERRLGFCPPSLPARLAFLTAPPLTVHLSSWPAPFSSGMGGKKGSIEMRSGETQIPELLSPLRNFGPLSNLETIAEKTSLAGWRARQSGSSQTRTRSRRGRLLLHALPLKMAYILLKENS